MMITSDDLSAPPVIPAWLRHFPELEGLEPLALARLAESTRLVTLPAGHVLFRPGSLCEHFMLVLEGEVRVQKTALSGREILLYRVEAGQSCILTTVCLINAEAYSAEGLAETDLRGVLLPAPLFRELLAASDIFRRFVFAAYATRLAGLLCLIDDVAFGRIDIRLAQRLAESRGALRITHQELAAELGTAREVVSRQLKEFERRGWVALGRGRVDILRADALAALASQRDW